MESSGFGAARPPARRRARGETALHKTAPSGYTDRVAVMHRAPPSEKAHRGPRRQPRRRRRRAPECSDWLAGCKEAPLASVSSRQRHLSNRSTHGSQPQGRRLSAGIDRRGGLPACPRRGEGATGLGADSANVPLRSRTGFSRANGSHQSPRRGIFHPFPRGVALRPGDVPRSVCIDRRASQRFAGRNGQRARQRPRGRRRAADCSRTRRREPA